ncbi:hypothetical protein SKAU_G00140840 [Synaphobranchus kaupii]|uniref:Uncharacterized protein n=1 Tax=Synaphobranchus kaupii TaxID=118154 RepID=A0A9Q1J489_SYNKA|nr:hypothetical protein SKAU_G00140840 [Synaphobranchus kaupii]
MTGLCSSVPVSTCAPSIIDQPPQDTLAPTAGWPGRHQAQNQLQPKPERLQETSNHVTIIVIIIIVVVGKAKLPQESFSKTLELPLMRATGRERGQSRAIPPRAWRRR